MRPSRFAFATVLAVLAVTLPLAAGAQPTPLQPAQIINLGHVEVWSIPDEPPPPPPDPQAIKAGPAAGVFTSRPVSLEEARALADFTLVFPGSLPAETLTLVRVDVLALPDSSGEVALIYRDPAVDPRIAGPRDVVIHQRRWAGITRIMLLRPLEEGTVAGRPAIFWSFTLPAPATAAGAVTRDFVIFERGDLLITIDGAGLTREELIRIAESLTEES